MLVNLGKTWFTGALPELWLFALGALFIFVTLFLPQGLMGLFAPRARAAATDAAIEAAGRAEAHEMSDAIGQQPTRCCISTASPSASTGSAR